MTSLSKSALWHKMQEYYHNMGPEAWQDEVVPLQISSNKSLALSYANIIMAHICDWLANQDQDSAATRNSTEPFYIIEIGAGHGRFSFYVIKCLQEIAPIFGIAPDALRVIITDIAEKNVASCEQHPALQSMITSGIVDFAVFNAMTDTTIQLRRSGQTIAKGSLTKPLFVIANYLFDSLAHDAFLIKNHELHEVQIHIDSEADWTEYFAKAKFSYDYIPLGSNTKYYADEILNRIIRDYAATIDDCTFMVPIGGLDCINAVQNFTKASLVLLLADKGYAHPDLFDETTEPDISEHGSISLMVNFDLLRQYFVAKGGLALLMPDNAVDFQVACFCSNVKFPIRHTEFTFRQVLSGSTPQDIINLCYDDEEVVDIYKTLDQVLSVLKLTHWDPNIFYDLHETLLDYIDDQEINAEQDQAMLNGLKIAWDYYFKVEKTSDLPYALAAVYYALDEYELALKFYAISQREFGTNADNLYNMAITYQALDDDQSAKVYAEKALQNDPEYTDAQELLAELAQI